MWWNNKSASNDIKSISNDNKIENSNSNISSNNSNNNSNNNSSNNSNNSSNSNVDDEKMGKKSTKFVGYILKTVFNIDPVDSKPIHYNPSPTIPSSSSSSSSSKTTTITIDNKESVSTGWFFALSLASLSGGMLYGVHTVVKRENTKLRDVIKNNSSAFSTASRAFLYGTILCCGVFIGSGAIFISLTGITSFKELGESSRRNFQQIDDTTKQRQRIAAEKKIMKVYNEAQEMDYWKKLFDRTFSNNESNESNNNSNESNNSKHSK